MQNKLLDRFINSSNLCVEIMQPSIPSHLLVDQIITPMGGEPVHSTSRTPAEISLCTLSSVDLSWYNKASSSERDKTISVLVRALDNTFEIAFYPVKGAELYAKQYRYIGIGVFNYAKMLAEEKLHFDDNDALEVVDEIFRDLSGSVMRCSIEISGEKGAYPAWNKLHGPQRRNALTMAIAPTASSGRVVNSTESSEPIRDFMVRYEATVNLPSVVPNFKELNEYYDKAFDIDQKVLIKHAAVSQRHLDQSQSVNLYLKEEYAESAKALVELHEYALDNGIKTLYYAHSLKDNVEDICESCT